MTQTFPIACIKAGERIYTLMSEEYSERYPGDKLAYTIHEVFLAGVKVSQIQKWSYDTQYNININGIRWMGSITDPRFQGKGELNTLFHDCGHVGADLDKAFDITVRKCEAIIAFRSGLNQGTLYYEVAPTSGRLHEYLWGGDANWAYQATVYKNGARMDTFHGFGECDAERKLKWWALNNGYRLALSQ